MAKTTLTDGFERTSFLYGGNAQFIEQLHARYQQDPESVEPEWRAFFANLQDDREQVIAEARGPSWQHPDWPQLVNGELVSALDGNWVEVERQMAPRVEARVRAEVVQPSAEEIRRATMDSVRALMMI